MDRRILDYVMRRMDGSYARSRNESRGEARNELESRRRRRDGTFMGEGQVEIEYEPQGERPTDRRYRMENTNHKPGPDSENRRRIGFGQPKNEKSHWSEEEFVGDMEESLYHEVDDIFHYVDIMEKVYKKGYDDLACVFYEIANEKFICSEFLRHQLKKIGNYNPSEHEQLEKDLEEAKKMFREQ